MRFPTRIESALTVRFCLRARVGIEREKNRVHAQNVVTSVLTEPQFRQHPNGGNIFRVEP